MARIAHALLAAWTVFLSAVPASAQAPAIREAPWALELALAGGAMVSNDQTEVLELSGGGTARLGIRVRPLDALGVDWIEGDVGGGVLVVGPGDGEIGGVFDVSLGARVAPRLGDLRPYLAIGVGVGVTGPLVRAVGRVAIGLAFPLGDEISLAPEAALLHVVQDDGPRQSDDALFASLGLSLAYRPAERPPPPEPEVVEIVRERERIVVRDGERQEARVFVPPPPEPPPPDPVSMDEIFSLVERAVPGSTLRVVLLVPPILFDHDLAVLTPAGEVAMHDVLDRVADAPADARIVVEGHADQSGEVAHNLGLSRERARVVADWLVARGVDRDRIRQIGEGAARPLVVGEGVEALAPNRRVTIRIESHEPAPATPEESTIRVESHEPAPTAPEPSP
jgi:outer membrane protein OmpA-like peptidoglycan-associated protein